MNFCSNNTIGADAINISGLLVNPKKLGKFKNQML